MENISKNPNLINDNEVLDIAMEIGLNLLKYGAEITRVEETINIICKAYGADTVDCFAIPSLIITTIERDSKTYTSKIKRNYKVTNNLFKIEEYNQLSRDIFANKPPIEEVRARIKEIREKRIYHPIITILGAMLAAGGCTMFFGGNILDIISSAIVGMCVQSLSFIRLLGKHKVIFTFLASIIGGFISYLLYKIGLASHLAYVMIGGVMILIPGIYICTSLKDIIYGDVISGTIRLVQAAATSIAIAIGFSFWSAIFKIDLVFTNTNPWWMLLIGSAVASVGFGIIFNVKPNKLLFVFIGGAIVYLIYKVTLDNINYFDNDFIPVLLAVAVGSLYAEIFARIIKAPAITIMLPSIIILVPGATLFFTMHNLIYFNPAYSQYLINTVLSSLAIALGIIISQIAPIVFRQVKKILIKKKKAS